MINERAVVWVVPPDDGEWEEVSLHAIAAWCPEKVGGVLDILRKSLTGDYGCLSECSACPSCHRGVAIVYDSADTTAEPRVLVGPKMGVGECWVE